MAASHTSNVWLDVSFVLLVVCTQPSCLRPTFGGFSLDKSRQEIGNASSARVLSTAGPKWVLLGCVILEEAYIDLRVA